MSAAVVTMAACAATPSPTPRIRAARADSARVGALFVPNHIAGFQLIGRQDFESALAGVRLRYAGPRPSTADVYLYPIVPSRLATSPAGRDSAARAEYVNARNDIFDFQRRGREEVPRVLSEQTLRVAAEPGRMAEGRRGSFAYTRGGEPLYSHLYVFAVRDRYVKVRCSYLQSGGPTEPPEALEQFVTDLVRHVAEGYTDRDT